MIFQRNIASLLLSELGGEPKIIVLYGPRQTGKTTLINQITSGLSPLFLNGDDIRTQTALGTPDLDKLKNVVGQPKLLVIDEAQRIPNIGLSLKLLYDYKPFPILVSGSSSFELANHLAEPLTGRATFFTLYPLAIAEIPLIPPKSQSDLLREIMLWGSYPKVHSLQGSQARQLYLNDVINTYLYKDLLAFQTIRKPQKVIDLLSLLALQIGSEVSTAELAENLSLSRPIVDKYLDVLEKMFVIVNLRGFSRNLRKEISKTSKYYFVDLGIRNALINNLNPLELRNDAGHLFENLCIVEKIKHITSRRSLPRLFFWRTHDQQEIDLIDERSGHLYAYEFKLSPKNAPASPPKDFTTAYPNSTFTAITPESFSKFLNQP